MKQDLKMVIQKWRPQTENYKELVQISNMLESLEEMDGFLDTYNLPKQSHDVIGNLNTYVTKKLN